MIRVMLVDDTPIALHVIQRLLSGMPGILVVGTATNGKEALELLPKLNPDVICTDLHMPVMDGLEFTRVVMSKYPRPILVVSVSLEPGSQNIFRMLEAGAVDIFPKPRDILHANEDDLAKELASKIRVVAGVHVFRRTPAAVRPSAPSPPPVTHHVPVRMVMIGASTGGPQALREIISHLPANFPVPVVCVQHIGGDFLSGMIAWLDEECLLPVRKAAKGELPQAGVVYFAPEDTHLEFGGDGHFLFSRTSPYDGHRPSATIAMRAAAHRFGERAVGVLLTGMGRDGAEGMAEIAAAGGVTIAQNEASCVVYGMPKAAVELGAALYELSIEQIAPVLTALSDNRNKADASSRWRASP